jgi:hypothetical protein
MKTFILLLIAFCLLPVGAQKRTRRQSQPVKLDPLTEILKQPAVDENGWTWLGATKASSYWFRPGKIISISPTVKDVWIKFKYTDILEERLRTAVSRERQGLKFDGYNSFLYRMYFYRVQCDMRLVQIQRVVDYDTRNTILSERVVTDGEWETPLPDTALEQIADTACEDLNLDSGIVPARKRK